MIDPKDLETFIPFPSGHKHPGVPKDLIDMGFVPVFPEGKKPNKKKGEYMRKRNLKDAEKIDLSKLNLQTLKSKRCWNESKWQRALKAYNEGRYTQEEIANLAGVSQGLVSQRFKVIESGGTWQRYDDKRNKPTVANESGPSGNVNKDSHDKFDGEGKRTYHGHIADLLKNYLTNARPLVIVSLESRGFGSLEYLSTQPLNIDFGRYYVVEWSPEEHREMKKIQKDAIKNSHLPSNFLTALRNCHIMEEPGSTNKLLPEIHDLLDAALLDYCGWSPKTAQKDVDNLLRSPDANNPLIRPISNDELLISFVFQNGKRAKKKSPCKNKRDQISKCFVQHRGDWEVEELKSLEYIGKAPTFLPMICLSYRCKRKVPIFSDPLYRQYWLEKKCGVREVSNQFLTRQERNRKTSGVEDCIIQTFEMPHIDGVVAKIRALKENGPYGIIQLIANDTGIDRKSISDYIHGRHFPQEGNLKKLQQWYDNFERELR